MSFSVLRFLVVLHLNEDVSLSRVQMRLFCPFVFVINILNLCIGVPEFCHAIIILSMGSFLNCFKIWLCFAKNLVNVVETWVFMPLCYSTNKSSYHYLNEACQGLVIASESWNDLFKIMGLPNPRWIITCMPSNLVRFGIWFHVMGIIMTQ